MIIPVQFKPGFSQIYVSIKVWQFRNYFKFSTAFYTHVIQNATNWHSSCSIQDRLTKSRVHKCIQQFRIDMYHNVINKSAVHNFIIQYTFLSWKWLTKPNISWLYLSLLRKSNIAIKQEHKSFMRKLETVQIAVHLRS